MPKILIPFLLLAGLTAQPALAYVGPGSGLGAVGVVLGLIGTIFLTLLSFIWYPVTRLGRKLRRKTSTRRGAPLTTRRQEPMA